MPSRNDSTGDRSVSIGGNASSNIIQTGDGNYTSLQQVFMPPPESVDIKAEVVALREVLSQLSAPDQGKVNNALADAEAELEKSQPDKDEVGAAIDRALAYAQKAEGFAKVVGSLKPHLISTAAWLGSNWDRILATVGLSR